MKCNLIRMNDVIGVQILNKFALRLDKFAISRRGSTSIFLPNVIHRQVIGPRAKREAIDKFLGPIVGSVIHHDDFDRTIVFDCESFRAAP